MIFNLTVFIFNWFFRNKTRLLAVGFQSFLLLFFMALGFSQVPNIQSYFPSIFLICTFFMGQFLLVETHYKFSEEKTLQSLLLSGVSPNALFVSLLLTFTVWMLFIECILWILMHTFFQVNPIILTPSLLVVLISGTISYVSLGILFYGFCAFSKIDAMFVMILFFTLQIPLFLFFYQALETLQHAEMTLRLLPLIGMNLLFVFSSLLLYEFMTEDLT